MLFTAPEPIDAFDFDEEQRDAVFLAGGISGCEDWQSEVIGLIDSKLYDVYNPRRPGGLEKDGEEAAKQIAWERNALARAKFAIFWFPPTSICPIALFEYGVMLERASRGEVSLLVGRDPAYERAFDLDTQTQLVAEHCEEADDLPMAHNFDELKAAVSLWFGFWNPYE